MKPEEKPVKPVAKTAPVAPTPEPAQPVAQQVQYVKMEKSLEGVGGWLIFWIIMFALSGIGFIMTFFTAISVSNMGGDTVTTLIFAPLLAIGFITAAVLISMQKKLAVLVSYITIGLAALYSIISSIVAYSTVKEVVNDYSYYGSRTVDTVDKVGLPVLIGGIIATLVISGLIALYFYQSKRVKATLVK